MALGALTFWPVDLSSLVSSSSPALTYQESLERIEHLRRQTSENVTSFGQPIFMDQGACVENVIIFLHGFTSTPRQFKSLGEQFYQKGYNVYIPRIPYHGHRVLVDSDLDRLTAEDLVQISEEAVDIAQGLGEHVTIIGLSMGGVMASWVAQHRSDVDQVIILAPNYRTRRTPGFFYKQVMIFLLKYPNRYVWWSPRLKSGLIRPNGTYQGFSSRALGEIQRMGLSVMTSAQQFSPKAQSILMISNANDTAVNKGAIDHLVQKWRAQAPSKIAVYEFSAEQNLGHDLIDPQQTHQKTAVVYPIIISFVTGKME